MALALGRPARPAQGRHRPRAGPARGPGRPLAQAPPTDEKLPRWSRLLVLLGAGLAAWLPLLLLGRALARLVP